MQAESVNVLKAAQYLHLSSRAAIDFCAYREGVLFCF
jgi:hypothetical protein